MLGQEKTLTQLPEWAQRINSLQDHHGSSEISGMNPS
jgi:hypothetical protein